MKNILWNAFIYKRRNLAKQRFYRPSKENERVLDFHPLPPQGPEAHTACLQAPYKNLGYEGSV
jgi:hypothetical protein